MELSTNRAKSAPPLGKSIRDDSGSEFRTAVNVATFVRKLQGGQKLSNEGTNCVSFHETGKTFICNTNFDKNNKKKNKKKNNNKKQNKKTKKQQQTNRQTKTIY